MSRHLWLLLLCTGLAFGANEKGNDDVVICRDGQNQITRMEILDYWEGKFVYRFAVALGDKQLPVGDKVEIALQRLERLDPLRAARYRVHASQFFDDTLCLTGVHLPNMNDYKDIPLADNCTIDPVAFQKEPFFPEDKRYWLRADYWKLLDNDNRAGLVLHEVIYREAMSRGQKDSKIARYLDSFFSSKKSETWTQDFYDTQIVKFGFGLSEKPAQPLPRPAIRMPEGFCENPTNARPGRP